jgi:hypothetical protein
LLLLYDNCVGLTLWWWSFFLVSVQDTFQVLLVTLLMR